MLTAVCIQNLFGLLILLYCSCINCTTFLKEKWKWSCSVMSDFCDPMHCSLPHSSIHGIFQARVLECVAISFRKGSSQPRDQTQVSRIIGRRFAIWTTREVASSNNRQNKNTNQIINRQDYHLTQSCPSEEKQTNKQKAQHKSHPIWTNLRRAETKRKKELNLEVWAKET